MVLDIRRHQELFDADLFDTQINIIGAGATGSWLVLQLAKLGIKGDLIKVYDFDTVEEHNIPNQAYNLMGHDQAGTLTLGGDLGRSKVSALQYNVFQATNTQIKAFNEKYDKQRLSGYVFLMVDSMSERKRIYEESIKMKSSVKLLVEPRMGLDVARVYNVEPMNLTHHERYENCYYSDEEAEVSACGTSQTVISTAMLTASWCVRQLINHHAGEELDNEILIDAKYNNIVATKW